MHKQLNHMCHGNDTRGRGSVPKAGHDVVQQGRGGQGERGGAKGKGVMWQPIKLPYGMLNAYVAVRQLYLPSPDSEIGK